MSQADHVDPRRTRSWRTVAIAGALVIAAACGAAVTYVLVSNKGPAKPVAQAQAPSPIASTVQLDSATKKACELQDAWIKGGTPGDYVAIKEMADAAKGSPLFEIRFRGQMLDDRRELAEASVGMDDHFKYEIEMTTAVFDLGAQCIRAGAS